jgi:hypothetical protein
MFNSNSLNDLIGIPFFYNDKETGVGWNIEIFEVYREAMFDSTVIILTDNIKVKLSHLDMIRGAERVFQKLHDSYEKQIGELNG